jgi:hypothetical protein
VSSKSESRSSVQKCGRFAARGWFDSRGGGWSSQNALGESCTVELDRERGRGVTGVELLIGDPDGLSDTN